MSDYFAVLSLDPPLDRDGVRRLSQHSCLDIHRVEWRRAYLSGDGTRMLCWFEARDAESVRHVLRQQGSGGDVWPAEISAANPSEASEASGSDRVVVEIESSEATAEAPESCLDAAIAAVESAGLSINRTLRSINDRRSFLAIDGNDARAVLGRLQTADLAPNSLWPAIELDPQPAKLFASGVSQETGPVQVGAGQVGANVDVDAVIIGAGISGIAMLQRLLDMGLSARVFESAEDVGGVWHWNRYPGARVDSESYTYLYSFSDELIEEWDWRELFAPQADIERYLQHVVDRFDLRRHMRFRAPVASAVFDEPGSRWHIETGTGERVTSRYLIAATGALTAYQLPDYPGIADFAGEIHHTARWPAGGVELSGKRVGVIGTGATGVQVIQTIAAEVAELAVFQRTPTYCIPQRNRPLTDEERRQVRQDWSEILAACRSSYGGFVHNFDTRSGLAVSAEEREAKFEELWQKPGFAFWFGNFADLMMNDEVNAHASDFVRRKIMARVHDPAIARRLLPDHPFGAKRVPLENGYYEVFNRDNVTLVDLHETPIERMTSHGIRTTEREHPLDVIICATGFDAGTGALSRIDIRGEAGLSLADKWRDGPATFLGLMVSGFPNLFMVNGPHNAAALCNAGRCIEHNVEWIASCIERMREKNVARIAALPAAEKEWTRHVEESADASVLKHMKESWFFGANTPGKARRAGIYAPGAREYREHCEDVARAGYAGCLMT